MFYPYWTPNVSMVKFIHCWLLLNLRSIQNFCWKYYTPRWENPKFAVSLLTKLAKLGVILCIKAYWLRICPNWVLRELVHRFMWYNVWKKYIFCAVLLCTWMRNLAIKDSFLPLLLFTAQTCTYHFNSLSSRILISHSKLKYAEVMVLCLINGVTLCNLPYRSHKNVYRATMMYGKLDKSFDM